MEIWYHVAKQYAGQLDVRTFEVWFWMTMGITYLDPLPCFVSPSVIMPIGAYACHYHGCPKVYTSNQARNGQLMFFLFLVSD